MKKVAIVGTAHGCEDAPFFDAEWEVWGLNTLYQLLTPAELARCTRWFEIHGDTPLTRSRRPADHWESLEALGIPIYTLYELPTITNVVRLDPDDLVAKTGGRDYFACTMCYQVALALSEGATDIAFYGMELTSGREAVVERPVLEWWIGFAEGRGVNVSRHFSSDLRVQGLLSHPYRYAFDDEAERTFSREVVERCYRGTMSWLLEEARRLNLQPEERVNARRGRLRETVCDA